MTDAAAPNAAQEAYWNSVAGDTWAALQDVLDAQLAGITEAAMQSLAPAPGDSVLDVGCGCGGTSLELARRVGPGGSVTGVDLSGPMLEVARRRAQAEGLGRIRFVRADAQAYAFEPEAFDAAFSRFGVMFFADPAAAFRNIRGALRPGGRLAFVCWRSFAENPWMSEPLQAALERLPPQPPAAPPDPEAPGPFAFANPDRVRRILADAGWAGGALAPLDLMIGGRSLEESVTTALKVGPLGALLRESPEHREAAVAALRESFVRHLTPEGVRMASAAWIVTARNPA